MNKTFKVVWSKARNAYVVVSELAKNSTKGCSGKRLLAMLIAIGVMSVGVMGSALAADIKQEGGSVVYDISPQNDGSNIAIGENARVVIGGGTQESILSFGETVDSNWLGQMNIHNNTAAKQNLPSAIAVGKNTYARTGSIQIGDHTLEKNNIAIGDTTASQIRQFGTAATTLGTNSYTGGGYATTIGSYNVQSSQYDASGGLNTLFYSTKNAFGTVLGTFNSNESMNGTGNSGVANVITGSANKVTNSNGAIVMGAGNTVKDSSGSIAMNISSKFDSVSDMQNALIDGIRQSSGGATMAIGGGNQAEYTSHSQIMGVNNELKGASSNKPARYNFVDGYNNKVTNSDNVSVLGQSNTVTGDSNKIIGDNHTVTGKNNVIFGSASESKETQTNNATILGYNANVTVDGGVALGADSVAGTNKGEAGYDPSTKKASTDTSSTWKSTAAAVSVGNAAEDITRQITGVAAGIKDTDAVNVAQLKKVATDAASAADTNTAKNDVTNISGSTDSDGVMTITQTTRTDTMSNGVWEKGEEKTTTITGIASTQYVDNKFSNVENKINRLDSRIDKVGAGAAALAALHPLDFDPDDKLQFSAGIGNYKGQNAAAIGMFYRPDEKVLFSVGGTVGNDENMVNAGVTFSLDRTARVTNTKTAMAKEIIDLRAKVVELTATVEKMGTRLGTIDEDKVTLFPDIDENHWAYEYVGKLAAAGIIEGYPDGNFGGDRMMSRYEFAAMLYRAMQNGAQLDGKIIKEFAPEMGRIRVDRISGGDNDKHKVERVRTNGDEKDAAGNVTQYRDHYGSKITPASK